MKPRKILLATARAISGSRLARRIALLPGYEICGTAQDLSSAYMLCERNEPDLALIGSELLRLPEFEGLLSLFRVAGIAWLEIPQKLPDEAAEQVASALPAEGHLHQPELRAWLLSAPKQSAGPQILPHRTGAGADGYGAGGSGQGRPFRQGQIILIGASTGGIDALLTILSGFPADCPPCAIVQHTGSGFSDSLVRLFARCCAAKVLPALPGQPLLPGVVVLGAGCPGHLTLSGGKPRICELTTGPAVSGHTPSIDMLFRSAVPFAPSVTAALLTGMGRDGAAGLLDLRRAGAATFAQDEASSTVYGMPRAAVEIGAAQESLPLSQIAGELLAQCRERPAMPLAR